MSANSLHKLIQQQQVWRASEPVYQSSSGARSSTETGLSTGFRELNRLLPNGGWPKDQLVELLCSQQGIGELRLFMPALAKLNQDKRWIAWLAPEFTPYAPALAQQGINLDQVLWIQTHNLKDRLWAFEQCLASGHCSAVLGWAQQLRTVQIKRLVLAAQKGKTLGLLFRPHQFHQQASPAPLRIQLQAYRQQLQLRLIKCRGQWGGAQVQLPLSPIAHQNLAATSNTNTSLDQALVHEPANDTTAPLRTNSHTAFHTKRQPLSA